VCVCVRVGSHMRAYDLWCVCAGVFGGAEAGAGRGLRANRVWRPSVFVCMGPPRTHSHGRRRLLAREPMLPLQLECAPHQHLRVCVCVCVCGGGGIIRPPPLRLCHALLVPVEAPVRGSAHRVDYALDITTGSISDRGEGRGEGPLHRRAPDGSTPQLHSAGSTPPTHLAQGCSLLHLACETEAATQSSACTGPHAHCHQPAPHSGRG
jgi:hypothetical protein